MDLTCLWEQEVQAGGGSGIVPGNWLRVLLPYPGLGQLQLCRAPQMAHMRGITERSVVRLGQAH